MKGNAKICMKNSRFEPPVGVLRVNAQGLSVVDGKHIVDFLLVIIELFSLALTAEALLSKICRNRRFLNGWIKFYVDGDVARNPSMDH